MRKDFDIYGGDGGVVAGVVDAGAGGDRGCVGGVRVGVEFHVFVMLWNQRAFT